MKDLPKSRDILLALIGRWQRELGRRNLVTSRLKRDQDNGIYGFIKKTVISSSISLDLFSHGVCRLFHFRALDDEVREKIRIDAGELCCNF